MTEAQQQDFRPRPLAESQIKPKPISGDITVVIPTLGREILEESLYCIAEGSAWPQQLIVVDQGMSKAVSTILETLNMVGIPAQYVPSNHHGRASGLNLGIEHVQTCYFAVTDDDCFVDEYWLERMVTCLRQNPIAIVSGRVLAGSDDVVLEVTASQHATYHKPSLKYDPMSGGNMGTSRAVIKHVGLFDEDQLIKTAEDGEWAYRALRKGVPIIYNPDVVVTHYGWRDETLRTEQYRDYARSHGCFYGKYLRQGDGFIALRAFIHYSRAFRRWIRGLVTRNKEQASYGYAYLSGLPQGIIAAFKQEHSA